MKDIFQEFRWAMGFNHWWCSISRVKLNFHTNSSCIKCKFQKSWETFGTPKAAGCPLMAMTWDGWALTLSRSCRQLVTKLHRSNVPRESHWMRVFETQSLDAREGSEERLNMVKGWYSKASARVGPQGYKVGKASAHCSCVTNPEHQARCSEEFDRWVCCMEVKQVIAMAGLIRVVSINLPTGPQFLESFALSWLIGWLVEWLIGWWVDCSVGWLRLLGSLVGWVVGWLVNEAWMLQILKTAAGFCTLLKLGWNGGTSKIVRQKVQLCVGSSIRPCSISSHGTQVFKPFFACKSKVRSLGGVLHCYT